jgi:hypothetical protein
MPITSQIPHSNDNMSTYEDGYDSDGQLGPFYDAVANQKDDDDDDDDDEEQMPWHEVSDESVQQEPPKIAPEANLPNFQLMSAAQHKDELWKCNLPVTGHKELLLQCLSAPPAVIHCTTNSDGRLPQQPANAINGFAPHTK